MLLRLDKALGPMKELSDHLEQLKTGIQPDLSPEIPQLEHTLDCVGILLESTTMGGERKRVWEWSCETYPMIRHAGGYFDDESEWDRWLRMLCEVEGLGNAGGGEETILAVIDQRKREVIGCIMETEKFRRILDLTHQQIKGIREVLEGEEMKVMRLLSILEKTHAQTGPWWEVTIGKVGPMMRDHGWIRWSRIQDILMPKHDALTDQGMQMVEEGEEGSNRDDWTWMIGGQETSEVTVDDEEIRQLIAQLHL